MPKDFDLLKDPNYRALKAKQTNNIKLLLQDYFMFRVYVKFNNGATRTFYGNEHTITYNQLLHKQVPHIELSRLKGYTDLLGYIENSLKGKFQKAILYGRSEATNKFDTLCRRYFKGQIEEINDPMLTDQDKIILEYTITNHLVIIIPPAGMATDQEQLPDFKTIINEQLHDKKSN